MIASLLLALLVTLSGTVATYLYDENASLGARLCAGAALGLATLGLVTFVVASFIGLSDVAVLFSTVICCSPLALLTDARTVKRLQQDLAGVSTATRQLLRFEAWAVGYFLFYTVIAVLFWQVFSRAVIEDNTGLSTGLLNNFGDLPFHLSVITSFAFGNNLPPEDPTYAGVRFTYPFISDFVSAVFVRCGADLRQSMFIENYILGLSFVGLVHRWALVMVRDRLAAILTPLIVLLNGGMGWTLLFEKAGKNEGGLFGVLMDLPPSFTVIPETTWRWGNAVSTLLVPQRGFLMGLPLAVIAFTQWWIATDKRPPQTAEKTKKKTRAAVKQKSVWQEPQAQTRLPLNTRRMIAAGVAPPCPRAQFRRRDGNGRMPRATSDPLARVDDVLCCRISDRNPATTLVHHTQRSRCRQFLCVGSRLGPRPGKSGVFLVQEHGCIHPAAACRCSHQRRKLRCSTKAVDFLVAIHAMLYRSELPEDGAVDLGQHQSAVLLVARIRATRRVAAGETLAPGPDSSHHRCRPFCLCDIGRSAGRCEDRHPLDPIPGFRC
jgi:hypothetical protein